MPERLKEQAKSQYSKPKYDLLQDPQGNPFYAVEGQPLPPGVKKLATEREAPDNQWRAERDAAVQTLQIVKNDPNYQPSDAEIWSQINTTRAQNAGQIMGSRSAATESAKNASVDSDAVDFAVGQLMAGQPVTMGRGGKAFVTAVYSKANQELAKLGATPAELATVANVRKGLSTSFTNQEKIIGMMNGFVNNLDKQVDRVDQWSKDLVQRVGPRILNVPIREYKIRFQGSGEEAVLSAYLIEISNEIGKLSTGSAASIRELSESAQQQWQKIHDPNLSLADLKVVLNETKQMGKMRLDSSKEELAATQSALKNTTLQGGSAKPGGKQITRTGTDKLGRKVIMYSDGSWEYGK